MTSPDLTNVLVHNNIGRHEYPKQLQAHPAKKGEILEILDDSEKKLGTDWVWPIIIGSGGVIRHPSDTAGSPLK